MAAPQPSTSGGKRKKPKTNVETMRLLARILQKLEEEKRLGYSVINISDYLQRAQRYTGFHPDVLMKLKNTEEPITKLQEIDRSVIHNEIMYYYLNEQKLPTTRELFNALQEKIPPYMDIRSFRRMLVKMDYIWKKIPGYTLVIQEKPAVTFERYNYLKNITQYRKEKRPIIYVDEVLVNTDKGKVGIFNLYDIEVDTLQGINQHIISALSVNGVHCVKQFSNFKEESLEKWIQEDLLMSISTPSVIVFRNSKYNSKDVKIPPTIRNLKIEMIEWLDYHNVPCNVNMSKVELYSLVENYTNVVDKIYKIDKIIQLYGHVVLRLPEVINQLSPVTFVHHLIKNNYPESCLNVSSGSDACSVWLEIGERITVGTLKLYDNYVEEEEVELLKLDIEVDNIMDDITANMSHKIVDPNEEDSDLPTFSDSD